MERRTNIKEKKKIRGNLKSNLIGEKLLWFQENLPAITTNCSVTLIEELIRKYLSRFDEELEQIKIKHSVGVRKNRQHASREDIIKLTVKREFEEYKTCGLEIPDLMNSEQFELLRTWNGELRFLPNFKLKRYSEKYLQSRK
ncbi:hypothetical protein HHI36_013524 [Cryptolaemus montrouzieri]|uniref:Translation machinery-associated protein 16 n=1 Tax=Cryptolaemus montrouzieri TaxID=559131 RepID=A0ABD2NHZ3_9CUCU